MFIDHLVIFLSACLFFYWAILFLGGKGVSGMGRNSINIVNVFSQVWLIFIFNSYVLFYPLHTSMSSFNYFPTAIIKLFLIFCCH